MKRLLTVTLVIPFFLFCLPVDGQQPPAAAVTGPTPSGNVAGELRKVVAILQVAYRDGSHLETIAGTCFFVSVEDERLPSGMSWSYLVTDRHMAQPGIDNATRIRKE